MSDLFAGWSPAGVAALIAIVAGIVLLVVYAVQRGLVHRELEGIEPAGDPEPQPAAKPAGATRAAGRSRTLGALGATLLIAGLALGTVAAVGSWGTGDSAAGGPGGTPDDCARSWEGCPQATPNP